MKNIKGFTLIEIAIVLLIVSILLGYTLAMAPRQLELKQYKQAKQEMTEINEALYAFAQVNGYLPCPADFAAVSNGFECRTQGGVCDGNDPTVDTCGVWFGAIPAKTLGINGDYSNANLLTDPWGSPYGYQVSNTDGDVNGSPDFVLLNGMNTATMPSLIPDLSVCNVDPSVGVPGNDFSCGAAVQTVFGSTAAGNPCANLNVECAPAVIISRGKRNNNETSTSELENLDNGINDTVFISTTYSDNFDDIVKWISPNTLYSKMIEANQLP